MLVNCLSKLDMLKKLDSKVDGLDVTASSFKPLFIFIDTQGEVYNCQTAQSFTQEFNKRFGETLGSATRTIGKRKFVLDFLESGSPVEAKVDAPEEIIPVEKEEILDEMFDINVAKNLEEGLSKKEAKDALADYAQKFEIVLQKNKSFDKMIADLEQEVASA